MRFLDNAKAELDVRCDMAASEGLELEVDCSNRYYTDPAMLARLIIKLNRYVCRYVDTD